MGEMSKNPNTTSLTLEATETFLGWTEQYVGAGTGLLEVNAGRSLPASY